ncbi:hypothetical protein HMPREF0742_01548 [Rothia aeria F0184]|uniref:Uncharacterized protein n=1 Tax=Rothia aeria F0184 TaxID=888019 RepID=U7V336_9MICC|nr:hypothetical protein HMPREF0742_01548 [Rothia aeria F0184]
MSKDAAGRRFFLLSIHKQVVFGRAGRIFLPAWPSPTCSEGYRHRAQLDTQKY